jgi:hypothetical protein
MMGIVVTWLVLGGYVLVFGYLQFAFVRWLNGKGYGLANIWLTVILLISLAAALWLWNLGAFNMEVERELSMLVVSTFAIPLALTWTISVLCVWGSRHERNLLNAR